MREGARHTWYVSFDLVQMLDPRGRRVPRATATFPNEAEAREFARAKIAEGLIVNAGTINPQEPKRTIASSRIDEWIEHGPAQAKGDDA
jgi:hypothetical protein